MIGEPLLSLYLVGPTATGCVITNASFQLHRNPARRTSTEAQLPCEQHVEYYTNQSAYNFFSEMNLETTPGPKFGGGGGGGLFLRVPVLVGRNGAQRKTNFFGAPLILTRTQPSMGICKGRKEAPRLKLMRRWFSRFLAQLRSPWRNLLGNKGANPKTIKPNMSKFDLSQEVTAMDVSNHSRRTFPQMLVLLESLMA